MGKTLRVFGEKIDKQFWSDKPIQKGHPDYKEKWYHVCWYNVPYNRTHKSQDGSFSETYPITFYKCRCGKTK